MRNSSNEILVIGSGVAGLTAALRGSQYGNVTVIGKRKIAASSTGSAQGGIAASLAGDDTPRLHMQDTLKVGKGLSDRKAVKKLVHEGPKRIKQLIELADIFDTNEDGSVAFTREAAHSRRRVVHSGDSTGSAVERTLLGEAKRLGVKMLYDQVLIDLVVDSGRCYGAVVLDTNQNRIRTIYAKGVILATGGYAQLFRNNTNPEAITGDGIAIAYRRGAVLQDMEFVQFHPTTLFRDEAAQQYSFLISEAVRGEGGILLNTMRKRFMFDYHRDGELAPRDEVARAIFQEMQKNKSSHVLLDMSKINTDLRNRFPRIYHACKLEGHNIEKDLIPVVPAAHYCMGGIKTDVNGCTNIKALFAVGEVASSSVHGANRLASNSLLEGLVFGHRAAIKASRLKKVTYSGKIYPFENVNLEPNMGLRRKIQELMWRNVGIVRSREGLTTAVSELEHMDVSKGDFYTKNLYDLARLVTSSSLSREESRGAHYRNDFPKRKVKWKKHILLNYS